MKSSAKVRDLGLWGGLLTVGVASAVGIVAKARPASAPGDGAPLRQVATIPLPGVEGRIDHFGVDLEGKRLFMSALGNNTIEVLDLQTNKRVRTIGGLHEPQGVYYVHEFNKLFVANAEGGVVDIFDGSSFKPMGKVHYPDDADNVRYDTQAKRIYVGYGEGALGVIDPATGRRLGDIKLAAHPESFQLSSVDSRIFVNVPDAGHLAVIDRGKQAVVARWPVEGAGANFPMALDEADRRVFITCRNPAQVMVLDIDSGRVVARLSVVGDADDMFYDAVRKRIYVSGGEGAISVIEQGDVDRYAVQGRTPTAPGARTSFFVPGLNRLYLAVPHRGKQQAEVRVYQAI